MSLLTPVKVPVKVYKWDDVGAPALDKTAGCVATIFKACLVTGYGNKEAAGWTMPFGDTTPGVKVMQPNVSPETSHQVRLSADTGRGITIQVYASMTDVNTGMKKMECATPFHYGGPVTSGRWILIATEKSMWFFAEAQHTDLAQPMSKSGTYLFVGDVPSDNSLNNVYMRHSGGSYGATWGQKESITKKTTDGGGSIKGVLYNKTTGVVSDIDPISLFDSETNLSEIAISAPLFVQANNQICMLPIYAPSNNTAVNFDVINDAELQAINCCTSTFGRVNNVYVPTDNWVY